MKLNTMKLNNFKGIERMTIPFNGKTTILFGINGVGKSTVLRAIGLIYSNIIAKLTESARVSGLEYDDICNGKTRADIKAEFIFEDGDLAKYGCTISRAAGRNDPLNYMEGLTEKLEQYCVSKGYDDGKGNWIEAEKDIPIFVSYGVNRFVTDTPIKASGNFADTKFGVFDHAIESKTDFADLFQWFRNQEDIENQEKVRRSVDYTDKGLAAVKKAMLSMLEGFEDIYIDRNPLKMKVRKNGICLDILQLSDGEKCTLALFGDLARRLTLANPIRKNPLEGNGVVLIDELDLHMHTSWQRKAMGVLKDTFPNIQFIITTHSPQILGELDENFNLFYMTQEDSSIVLRSYRSFVGWDANVILEEVMNTSSVNQEIKDRIAEMYDHIEKKEYGKAEEIADALDEKGNGYIDGIVKARLLISRGRRREKNSETGIPGMV